MRAKLINDDLSKFEKRDLANFFGTVGSTPRRNTKEVQEKDNQCPMRILKKPQKIKEPMRNEEYQNNKKQKDLIDLLGVDKSDYLWCFEVCKGIGVFKSILVGLPDEIRGPLQKKFREAKLHFECPQCAEHKTELAQTGFVVCDMCDSLTHGKCSGLDEKEAKKAKFICVACR